MKAFSPAGMAVKAFYGGPGYPQGGSAGAGGRGGWVSPGTIGNPDAATSGGGAYAKGGANPDGPNQGGGGGGGGATKIMDPFGVGGVGSSGPSSNGPGQTYYSAVSSAFTSTPSGFTGGAFTPDPFSINGVLLVAFGQIATAPGNIPPNGNGFIVILNQAGLPQNFFTGVSFTLGDLSVYNLTTAGAMFNTPWDDTLTGSGYTTWVWTSNEPFFPPADFPNPITFTL